MRRHTNRARSLTRRRLGLPAAIVGSIALSLSTVSAYAADPVGDDEREPERQPSPLRAPGAVTVSGTGTPASTPTTTIVGTPAAATSYTVKRGDTVSAIAARHGLRTADVLAWNSLGWSSPIYPGQTLKLSGTGASAAPKTSNSSAGSAGSAAKTYTVKRGDTLWAIAARHKVSVANLVKLNGITGAMIHPGQKLKLSGGSASAAPAPSKPASSASASSGSGASQTHTVARGDTLWAIAARHGVSVASLLTLNGLKGSSIIYPGQKLAVKMAAAPASSSAPVAPAKTSAPAAPSAGASHTVVAGDTLWAIAQKHSTSVRALLTANALGESSIIYPGQKLTIPSATGLDAAQTANAQLIIRVGRDRGVSERGIAIALATAMVESGIRNLDYGDRDSLGLFQQRPSQGWGTEAQILDPYRSTAVFYGGAQDPNGKTTQGLLDIAGWDAMEFTDAAQAVQISAFPDRYGQWEAKAYAWLAALG